MTVDAAAIVAEIEAEVARRRAAGDYPLELIERLRTDFRVTPNDEPPEALAVVESSRALRSERLVVGPAVVFGKRVMRRLLAWYVSPIAEDQTRFNLSLLREVRAIERRLARVETPWAGSTASADQVIDSDALAAARVTAYGGALMAAGEGRTLVLGGGPSLVTRLGAEGVDAATADEPAPAAGPARRCDPLSVLEGVPAASLSGVVIAGLLPRLSPAEALRVIPAASAALRAGGVLVVDGPLPTGSGARAHPAGVHPAMRRWVPPETVSLLIESAGLTPPVVSDAGRVDGVDWYAVVSTRPYE
jgi:hypothetical protein